MDDSTRELLDEIGGRPPAGRTMPFVKVAEHLEMFGTTRADFRELSEGQRISVGKCVTILCSRHNVDGTIVGNEEAIFYHLCGKVGIDFGEARAMWNNAYKDGVTLEEVYEVYEE